MNTIQTAATVSFVAGIEDTMLAWYCIHTKPRQEDFAARQLRPLCEDVYLPLLRRRRLVRERLEWVTEPLIPGYVFARFSLKQHFEKVRSASGVAPAIGPQDGGPQEVDPQIIATLRQCSPHGYIEIPLEPLAVGEVVEGIIEPFQKLFVLFQYDRKAGARVAVLLDLLSAQAMNEIPRQRQLPIIHKLLKFNDFLKKT